MSHWSIRSRLALWYCAVLLAGLALFGGGLWLVISHSLAASLEESLARQARGVATVIESEYDPAHPQQLSEELSEYALATPGGNLIEVRDGSGGTILAGKAAVSGKARYRTLGQTVQAHGQSFHIVVAIPLAETEATLLRVRRLLLWTAPAVLLLASLGGYWISRRALAPVDAITRSARSIGIQNLSQRLEVPATGDELQRLSETWNDMLARLESAVNRLAQFTADASHELRTPVTLIRTTAELALRRERTPETYRQALRQIVAESERTTRLVEDLLLLARADAGLPALPLERLELTPLVRDVCEQGQVLAQSRKLEIAAETPTDPVYVEANDPALRRLLLLLVDNAVKYTPAGGRITVSVARDSAGTSIAVRDTGAGIPEDALPHVFERFYRGDAARSPEPGGAGLGLAIAKWIADRHRASLEAESVVGQGSTFRVRFP